MELMWVTYQHVLGFLLFSLVGWLLCQWNEIWYVYPVRGRSSPLTKIPPGNMGLPLLGEHITYLWYFKVLRHPDGFINSKKCNYKNDVGVYRSYLYGAPTIIVCSPSLCKLVVHSTSSFKHQWPTTQVVGPNSLTSIDGGAQHETIKSFIMGAVNRPNSLARMVLQSQPIVVTALQSWSRQEKIIANTEARKVTLEVIGRFFPNLEVGQKIDDLVECLRGTDQGARAHPWNFPGMSHYHALKCRKKVTKMLREVLQKRKRKATSTKGEESSDDLMDGFMKIKDKEGSHYLRDEEVLDNVINILETGCLGIAYLVTWSLYFLAKSPHVLQKLREENMGIKRDKNGESITYEDILKLTYTNKVVEEVIRLGNLVPFIFWKAIDDIEYEGYLIPKGWQVILWLRNLHTDPTNFDDPMHFNPNRWDTRPRYGTYLPFGGGPRVCPGSTFARIALVVFLHHLSITYKWELLNPNTKIVYLPHPEPECLEVSLSEI